MERRPRILLTNFHLGTGGGHRTYLLSLLQSSLAEWFDLALACPPSSSINSYARQSGSRVFDQYFPGSVKNFTEIIASIWNLERIHREFPFDIIHCNGSRDHWIAIYWKTLYRRAARIIRTRHAIKKVKDDFLHAWAFNRATAFNIYVSQGMLPLCQPQPEPPLRNFTVIANGIDTAYFQPRPRDLECAASLGITESDFVVGSNAGLGAHKRVDLMLEAIAGLPFRDKVKIVLLGENRSAGQYENLAKHQFGLKNNVIYAGMLDDVRPCLSLLHLGFVLSDSIETSSYAAKEMMAMRIPLVCARFSGLPENVDEGRNGFLIEPGNASDLRDKLATFFNLTPAARQALGDHSREKVVREFSRQRQIEAMAQVYRDVGLVLLPVPR